MIIADLNKISGRTYPAGDVAHWKQVFEGAKSVQLAEKGLESWAKRKWINIPELKR